MFRVNGLFGWVRANDRRSVMLFGGFIAALQVAAAIVLYLPLAGFDEAHAPFLNWGGYVVRYVPLVALAAAGVFAVMMFWHVHSVRRVIPFTFVDNQDEPRLCDLVETLAIGMGLAAPYVAVIETPAMNAFACGIRQGDAVVVVTRGLVSGLDDEELAAVAAHELAHIANGDIRLMAAANVCLAMLRRLMVGKMKRSNPLLELIGPPLVLLVAPPMLIAVLLLAFLSQCALRAGHLVRSMIGASREFIADAAAVEATQNPAALVSALQRIDGRSRRLAPLWLGACPAARGRSEPWSRSWRSSPSPGRRWWDGWRRRPSPRRRSSSLPAGAACRRCGFAHRSAAAPRPGPQGSGSPRPRPRRR